MDQWFIPLKKELIHVGKCWYYGFQKHEVNFCKHMLQRPSFYLMEHTAESF